MASYHQKCCALLGMLLIGLTTVGCNSVNPNKFGMPNFKSPGTAEAQRNRAVRFDPYPEPGFGPDTEGLRPRAYAKPFDELLRARWEIIE